MSTSNASTAPAMGFGLGSKLSVMMFLQYAIWGAWLPLLWPFLNGHRGFDAGQIGNMFAVGAIGAIVAPFIAGQIADRYFSTEKYLALSHILGGLLIWQLASVETYGGFLLFSLFYSLLYSPTMPLTNSLAFHHLPDRDRDFGRVRVWGTIGWITVGIGIGQWLLRQHTPAVGSVDEIQAAQFAGMADAFKLSAILGLVMGVFCFFLPHTPPKPSAKGSATGEALATIKTQPLITLFLVAIPISCIHQFYFVHTAGYLGDVQLRVGAEGGASQFVDSVNAIFGVGGAGLMTLGQMSEIFFLGSIPLFAKRFSRKTLLLAGTLAYAARMGVFAYSGELAELTGLSEIVIAAMGVTLHGPVFGFWIFLAFMIVDEETTEDVRASAQSLFNLVVVGIGVIVGSKLAAAVADWATVPDPDFLADGLIADGAAALDAEALGVLDFTRLFSVPMWASLGCLVVLVLMYPGGRKAQA